jgi:hypothetical protein
VRTAGLDVFQTFNQVGLAVKRATAGAQQPWVSSSPIDGTFYFVPPTQTAPPQVAAMQADPLPSERLRADPDRVPLRDAALLSELNERLYELNFDPDTPDGLTRAITKLQQRIAMAPTGEPTEGLLLRMRKMEDLKPWGSIVYGPDGNKWGMSWNHASRRAAVADGAAIAPAPNVRSSFPSTARAAARSRSRTSPGRWSSARACSAQRTPRLTNAARLAKLAALLEPSVPTAQAADFFHDDGFSRSCQTSQPAH